MQSSLTLSCRLACGDDGTPQDATTQELRIESFFPMDDDTREVLRQRRRKQP